MLSDLLNLLGSVGCNLWAGVGVRCDLRSLADRPDRADGRSTKLIMLLDLASML